MSEKDKYRLYTREFNKIENKKLKENTTHIISTSIKRQILFLITVIIIIIIIAVFVNAVGETTVNKVASISKTITTTGRIKDSDFIKVNEDGGYYELDIDKAYEELEEWAKKNGINLNNLGLTREMYGELLKLEIQQALPNLGGTAVGDNSIQGKIIIYRKRDDGTLVPMRFVKKAEWDQNIITKRENEISGLGIGATKATESDDMTTDESKKIWMALKTNGWSNMAIVGAMGNMYVESKYYSEKAEGKSNEESSEYTTSIDNNDKEKETFINDGQGYGLIQWKTSEDKEAIYNLAKSNQISIGDFAMQLKYMQSQAENNEKMKLFLEGKNAQGNNITEPEYAVTAFYEYWIKKNYDFDEKGTSDEERNKDNLATRWKAGKEIEEEYVYNQKLGQKLITGQQKVASSNKFLGLNNNKNNIKLADAKTGAQTAKNEEEKAQLEKQYDEDIFPTFTLDESGKVVIGSLYTVQITVSIEDEEFVPEEESINKILSDVDDGSEINSDINKEGGIAYQMEVREQKVDLSDVPSNSNLSAAAASAMLVTTPGDKMTDELSEKFNILIEEAKQQQGTEVAIQDFTTVVTTTQTETMNLKFDIKKTVEFKPSDSEDSDTTKTSEFPQTQERNFDDEDYYREIIRTEITKIPQAVIEKQKTLGKEVTYHYNENTSDETEGPNEIKVGDDDNYTGWVVCNKGGDGEKENEKVKQDYHNFLGDLASDVGGEVVDTHEHLVQTATDRIIIKQIDTSKSIYIKAGESVITNNTNALIEYIKAADPEEGMLREYLRAAGVKEEEIDEIIAALQKAKEEERKTGSGSSGSSSGSPGTSGSTGSNSSSGTGTTGGRSNSNSSNNSGNTSNSGNSGNSSNSRNSSNSGNQNGTSGSGNNNSGSENGEERVKIDFTLTNKLAKAAYDYIKKGVKYAVKGENLKTGVNNPQFVYQLLKTETQMYTGEYVDLKDWSTQLEDYIVGNDISKAEEGDVIVYKKINDDSWYRICIYSGKDNIIMEVDTSGGTTKKLDLNKYKVDRIYRFNEDGSAPETDPTVVRLIMIEPSYLKLEQKEDVKLKAVILPQTAIEDVTIKWESDNKKIATVNDSGEVTIKGYGKVTITATTNNGKSATAVIEIGKELQTTYTVDTKEDLSGVLDNTRKGQRQNKGAYVGDNEQAVVDGGSYKTYNDVNSLAKRFMDEYGVNITCSEDVHPRYYIGYTKMNISKNNKDLKSLDGQETIDIPKDTNIVVIKKEQIGGNTTGPGHANDPIFMNIQFKDQDGNVRKFQLNYAYKYLFLKGWIIMLGQRWSVSQAEEFVNKTCEADSQTNYCLWANPFNRVAFLFKGSKGNWRVIRIMDAGNGYWQWNPSSSSSADTSYPLSNAKNKNGQQKMNSKNGVVEDGLYYVIDYAGGNCLHAGSPLDYNVTHGCISLNSDDAKYLYENIPVGTKVILY